ncbi:methyltransferase [Candidatus Woesearchaeota archaeon]|nr:methyltransferase [Candidatus Woesearchaeota archaeon]
MMEIYHPREDSYLLEKYVKKHAKGICLDMGTGSGIQAKAAASSKKVVKVFALDINRQAVGHCREIRNKKIICLKSDLFMVFRGNRDYRDLKFDTIIFNPPYLPEEKKDKDIALDGGEKGYELIQKFLNQAKFYMKPRTIILLVFSSFTGRDKVNQYLLKKGFRFREMEKAHIFFEDIYCYKIMQK